MIQKLVKENFINQNLELFLKKMKVVINSLLNLW